jgi:hypothetical protein
MEQIARQPRTSVRLGGNQAGSTLIETALMLPLFFMLLFGVFKFAQISFGYNNASYAVHVAARYASLHSSTSVVPATSATVLKIITPYMYAIGANQAPPGCGNCFALGYSGTQNGNVIGNKVTVTIGMQYCIILPYYNGNCFILFAADTRNITR